MQKFLKYCLSAAIATLSLASCNKEEQRPPLHISVGQYEVTFTKEASSQSIPFCYIGDWAETQSSEDWVTSKLFFDNSEDGHMEELTISVTENTTGQPRTAEVVVSTIREGKNPGTIGDRIDRVITVIQSAE